MKCPHCDEELRLKAWVWLNQHWHPVPIAISYDLLAGEKLRNDLACISVCRACGEPVS